MQENPGAESIKKLYYSISEVSEMLGVKPHVLRYWETQFGSLRPKKSRAGNRMYRERDVEALRQIQELLHVRRYTIAGARRELSRLRASGSAAASESLSFDDTDMETSESIETTDLEHTDSDQADLEHASQETSAGSEPLANAASRTSGASPSRVESSPGSPPMPRHATLKSDSAPGSTLHPAPEHDSRAARKPHSTVEPSQTSFEIPRPLVPVGALTELREEIAGLKEWLELRAKN